MEILHLHPTLIGPLDTNGKLKRTRAQKCLTVTWINMIFGK